LYQPVQIHFLDMDIARIDRLDDLFVDVDTQNGAAGASNNGCGWQTDIAQSHDTNGRFFFG